MLTFLKIPKVKPNFLKNFFHFGKQTKFCEKLFKDNFLNGQSSNYLENMYRLWLEDKNKVNKTWNEYFSNLDQDKNIKGQESYNQGMSEISSKSNQDYLQNFNTNIQNSQEPIHHIYSQALQFEKDNAHQSISDRRTRMVSLEDSMKVILLIRAYQRNGYLNAKLDPLNLDLLDKPDAHYIVYESRSTLDYRNYGFTEEDLEKEFIIYTSQISGILSIKRPLKLKEIISYLEKAYCSTIGVDYMYISSRAECNFMREKFEVEWLEYKPTSQELKEIFKRVAKAVLFEEFLHKKFTTHKRFGLEGLESMVSGLKWLVDVSVQKGVRDVTIGMAHRGRLNVLANVMKKPLTKIFAEFQGKGHIMNNGEPEDLEIDYIQTGDVKYHLGTFHEKKYNDNKIVNIDLLANPSHLEAVDPVVMGKTRAKQHFSNDEDKNKNMAILIHGDASFAGQGVIYESMQMENLRNYSIGGVVHVISNNQIGFTTSPKDGRSTPFVSDIMKAYESPIIHVNADDPVAVDYASKVAAEYRHRFKKDIAIDIIGYRKFGHNELDQPMFTQPQMYNAIAQKKSVLDIFKAKIIEEEALSQNECDEMINKITEKFQNCYHDAENDKFDTSEWISKQWEKLEKSKRKYSSPQITGISIDKLQEINEKVNLLPKGYKFHNMIYKIYENRYKSVKEGKNIDMGTAEALCFGSLLDEGYTVRISGQDVERGTFSHRHAVLHDQIEEKKYIPLCNINKDSIKNFQPCNSHLSEFAVLGFELGFSYYNPDSLVIWEAQFGDFANGAQIIIDQFIAGGERKWNVQSGIILNLPHGMDGQGPEHSSARIERFLQMMDDDINDISYLEEGGRITQIQECTYQVCYPTTSSNYFHVLRRQLKRDFRKPLILACSKKLLKHKSANSNIEEFNSGRMFIKVRREEHPQIIENKQNVKMILACSGQVYYDLVQQREKLKRNDIAIVAVEQIAPFPYIEFTEAINEFPNAKLTWAQEEHVNQGAWEYVRSRINNLLRITKRGGELNYVGRNANSVASTGFHIIFEQEHKKLLEDAFKF